MKGKFLSAFGFVLLIAFSAMAQDLDPCQDSVYAQVVNDTIVIHHDGAWYNCCATIQFTLHQQDSLLDLYEMETFDSLGPCPCMCCFDLSVAIVDMEPALYHIRVWDEIGEVLFGEVDVVIGGGRLGPVAQSDCYNTEEKDAEEPCQDSVSVQVANDTLVVYHDGAWYNCCAIIQFTLLQQDYLLDLYEMETFDSLGPCWCMCCFDLSADIVDLVPGTYHVRVWNEDGTVLYGQAWASVGGSMKRGLLGPVSQSECYDSVSVPDISGEASGVPGEFALYQNCPNPFNPITEIRYVLPTDGWVKLEIFNLLGQRVSTLVDKPQRAGSQRVAWEGQDLAGGIYFCRLQTGNSARIRRMVLLK